ncbi:MAG: hypothetical protein WC261_04480 [Synergistaceae bacterium]|jgi:hypothetical protein
MSGDFDIKFPKVTKEILERAKIGMGQAGTQLMSDCVNIAPTVPIEEGWLRGSGSVFVDDELVAVSKDGKPGKANTSSPGGKKNNAITVIVGFNTPYAHRLHEGVGYKFTDPSSGPKFLESKMVSRRNLYMKIVNDAVKK